jgi:hypothetical protein
VLRLQQNNPAAISRPFHGHGVGDQAYPTLARKNSTTARIMRKFESPKVPFLATIEPPYFDSLFVSLRRIKLVIESTTLFCENVCGLVTGIQARF